MGCPMRNRLLGVLPRGHTWAVEYVGTFGDPLWHTKDVVFVCEHCGCRESRVVSERRAVEAGWFTPEPPTKGGHSNG